MEADAHGVPTVELRSVFGFNGELFLLDAVWTLRPLTQKGLTHANATSSRTNDENQQRNVSVKF